ncbi:PIN domain-like protein [Mycena leptocephala]|nr:PIN domain-like protein [Mycena leptocephala]
MGISVFWEIAKGAAQTMSFKELCIKEGFIEKRRDIGTMLIGVDACLWITQSQAVFHKPRHAQMGKNPELKALFYKLAILNQAGVSAVFAFDGSDRLSIKRDKQVKKKPNWLVAEFIKLIELFGFHYHMAPGEADADLGYLDEFECIDGILTDDGDVALFGARRILRRMNKAMTTCIDSNHVSVASAWPTATNSNSVRRASTSITCTAHMCASASIHAYSPKQA